MDDVPCHDDGVRPLPLPAIHADFKKVATSIWTAPYYFLGDVHPVFKPRQRPYLANLERLLCDVCRGEVEVAHQRPVTHDGGRQVRPREGAAQLLVGPHDLHTDTDELLVRTVKRDECPSSVTEWNTIAQIDAAEPLATRRRWLKQLAVLADPLERSRAVYQYRLHESGRRYNFITGSFDAGGVV
jgi:hypothetical protein